MEFRSKRRTQSDRGLIDEPEQKSLVQRSKSAQRIEQLTGYLLGHLHVAEITETRIVVVGVDDIVRDSICISV